MKKQSKMQFIFGLVMGLWMVAGVGMAESEPADAGDGVVTMYQDPNCGCCHKWAEHLQAEGFKVNIHKTSDIYSIKRSMGLPPQLASCHTATIGGYVIEGHVPASDIRRLLEEKPDVAGLTAPGMPLHSPGMQPPGEKPRGYDVLSFDKQGKTKVFSSY